MYIRIAMIYFLFRFIFRITVRVFFRRIEIKGAENIPSTGPIFIIANHPSGFMDPIVISTLINRNCYFLAKGAVFQTKFAKWLLPKFNMIPIYRAEETPDEVHKNEAIFEQCYHHFEKGGAIVIFPEGISITERKIKKIKTGTARIALGAEEKNNFSLGIKIVPIGLNYGNPHKFQTDLFLNIGIPVLLADYTVAYKTDPFQTVHTLTDEIRTRIEKTVVAIDDEMTDQLVSNIEKVYKVELLNSGSQNYTPMEKDFVVTTGIASTVQYFREHDPHRVDAFAVSINNYLEKLEQLSLHDTRIDTITKRGLPASDILQSVLYLLFGFPIFLYGVINNYLPFQIPFIAARRLTQRSVFYGSIFLTLGTLTFLIFYSFQIWLVQHFFHQWAITLLYAISLPFTGFFAFYYRRKFNRIRGSWRVLIIFTKKANLVAELIATRAYIISELEKGRAEFEHRTTPNGAQ